MFLTLPRQIFVVLPSVPWLLSLYDLCMYRGGEGRKGKGVSRGMHAGVVTAPAPSSTTHTKGQRHLFPPLSTPPIPFTGDLPWCSWHCCVHTNG
jgi:hypothetical protein